MRKKFIAVMLIILFSGIAFFFFFNKHEVKYSFSGNAFAYSMDRETPEYEMSLKETNGSVEIYSINFQSRDFLDYHTRIYGLLFIPANKKDVPGLVFLPGGGATKESLEDRMINWADLGYAIFVIDQRGVGETGGVYLSPEQDYSVFASEKEPVQHLSVYDGLAAYDILKNIKNIDRKNIAIAGESMGGRYAIIAAALDNTLKGVIAISSSGFHIKNDLQPYTPYLLSIDPDNYIGKISPRPVLMLQGTNDSVVKQQDAEYTFGLAKQPKRFFLAENCTHGYCDLMYNELKEDLRILFEE